MSKETGRPAVSSAPIGQEGIPLWDYFAAHAPITLSDARMAFHDVKGNFVQPTGDELMGLLAGMRAMYADMMLKESAA